MTYPCSGLFLCYCNDKVGIQAHDQTNQQQTHPQPQQHATPGAINPGNRKTMTQSYCTSK